MKASDSGPHGIAAPSIPPSGWRRAVGICQVKLVKLPMKLALILET